MYEYTYIYNIAMKLRKIYKLEWIDLSNGKRFIKSIQKFVRKRGNNFLKNIRSHDLLILHDQVLEVSYTLFQNE